MNVNFEFTLTTKQKELWDIFFNTPLMELSWIVNVGGKGSEKIQITIYILLRLLFDPAFKDSKILIAKESLKDLKNTIVAKIESYISRIPKDLIEHNKRRQVIEFKRTGSKIFYMSLSDKNDQYKSVSSYEFNVVIIDDADKISEKAFVEADISLRYPHPFQRGMININQVKENHWIYKYFVKNPKPHGLIFTLDAS